MSENLILFGYSGFDFTQNERMSIIAKDIPNCAVILMQDGVFGILSTGTQMYKNLISNISAVYCLKEDLQARGIEEKNVNSEIKIIDYGQLIDLIEKSERLISWL